MNPMRLACACNNHHPIHCIIPPLMLERMAESRSAKVRAAALKNIAMAAAFRAQRSTLSLAPNLGVSTSTNQGKSRSIYSAKGSTSAPGTLIRNEGDSKSGDAAVNEAYDFSGYTYDFYKKFHNRNSLDNNGMRLISTVHLGEGPGVPMNNAFWSGSQMFYGDGDGIVFTRFTKALDVVAHELTHGVTSFSSNLVYRDQSGALNEHFSDVFGSLVKQWRKKQTAATANWLIGEDILIKATTRRALRDLQNPGTAYANDPDLGSDMQPAHMRNYWKGQADNGGVHINSGIPNKAFALAARAIGGNAWELAGQIWYETLQQLHATANFADCARISRQIAASKGAKSNGAVDAAWKAVGL